AIWSKEEIVADVQSALLDDGFDAALLIQDFPPDNSGIDQSGYAADTRGFIKACSRAAIPAAVCSTISESMPATIRELLMRGGIPPLQGIDEGMAAIASAMWLGERATKIGASPTKSYEIVPLRALCGASKPLNEWQSKELVKKAGIAVPESMLCLQTSVVASA